MGMGRLYVAGKSYYLYYDKNPDEDIPEEELETRWNDLKIGHVSEFDLLSDHGFLVTRNKTYLLLNLDYTDDRKTIIFGGYKVIDSDRKDLKVSITKMRHSLEWVGMELEEIYLKQHLSELIDQFGMNFIKEQLQTFENKKKMKTLIEQLRAEKMNALREKNTLKKGIIDTTIGEIDRNPNFRPKIVDGVKEAPNDKVVLETIKRMVKNLSVVDSEQNKQEIEILNVFLPTQMSQEEIEIAVSDLIVSTVASSARDMGKVMGAFTKAYAGKADNKIVSQVIREKLSKLEEA